MRCQRKWPTASEGEGFCEAADPRRYPLGGAKGNVRRVDSRAVAIFLHDHLDCL
jgi:hypothetical protein